MNKSLLVLMLVLLTFLPACGLFAPDMQPIAESVMLQDQMYTDMSDSFAHVIETSTLTAEEKAPILAKINQEKGNYGLMTMKILEALSETGKLDWKEIWREGTEFWMRYNGIDLGETR